MNPTELHRQACLLETATHNLGDHAHRVQAAATQLRRALADYTAEHNAYQAHQLWA